MIQADPELTLDGSSSKSFIRFYPTSWGRPELRWGKVWAGADTICFSFWNSSPSKPNMLGLRLSLDETVSHRILEAATRAGSLFTPTTATDGRTDLLWKEILSTAEWEEYEDSLDFERLRSRLQEAWSALKSNELTRIREVIDQVFPE